MMQITLIQSIGWIAAAIVLQGQDSWRPGLQRRRWPSTDSPHTVQNLSSGRPSYRRIRTPDQDYYFELDGFLTMHRSPHERIWVTDYNNLFWVERWTNDLKSVRGGLMTSEFWAFRKIHDPWKGTSIFSEQLPGNFFLNVVIMGIVASLASVAVIGFNDCFSRQKFQAFTFLLAALSCILCSIFQAVIPEQTILIVTFGVLAKFAAQSEFLKNFSVLVVILVAATVIYLFTVELFPTTIRSTGYSCCNIVARFAMIFLPTVMASGGTIVWLPAALMGIVSVAGAMSTLLLPDTKGIDLLETLDDAEEFYNDHKICCCWN